jgi:hypothetical protein
MTTNDMWTTVRINRGLVYRVKEWANRHGVTISDAVTQLVSAGLANGVRAPSGAIPVMPSTVYRYKGEAGYTNGDATADTHTITPNRNVPADAHNITPPPTPGGNPMVDLATAITLLTEVVSALPKMGVDEKGSGLRPKTGS